MGLGFAGSMQGGLCSILEVGDCNKKLKLSLVQCHYLPEYRPLI